MSDVTLILTAIEQGDPLASERLLPLVYHELRKLAASKLAHERPDHTLQPTALVHEAYLRLVGSGAELKWDSRGHFFAAAAEAMRRILINRARDRKRLKRGGGWQRLDFNLLAKKASAADDELLALDEALEQLASEHPACAQLVKLRFFGGLSGEEAALALGIGRRTGDRYWAFAKAWLYDRLRTSEQDHTSKRDAVR